MRHPSIDFGLLEVVRRLLSVADQTVWAATVDSIAPYRDSSRCLSVATAYLVPDRRDWVDAAFAAGCEHPRHSAYLVYSAYRTSQLSPFTVGSWSEIATVIDAVGQDSAPTLVRSLH